MVELQAGCVEASFAQVAEDRKLLDQAQAQAQAQLDAQRTADAKAGEEEEVRSFVAVNYNNSPLFTLCDKLLQASLLLTPNVILGGGGARPFVSTRRRLLRPLNPHPFLTLSKKVRGV